MGCFDNFNESAAKIARALDTGKTAESAANLLSDCAADWGSKSHPLKGDPYKTMEDLVFAVQALEKPGVGFDLDYKHNKWTFDMVPYIIRHAGKPEE